MVLYCSLVVVTCFHLCIIGRHLVCIPDIVFGLGPILESLLTIEEA